MKFLGINLVSYPLEIPCYSTSRFAIIIIGYMYYSSHNVSFIGHGIFSQCVGSIARGIDIFILSSRMLYATIT